MRNLHDEKGVTIIEVVIAFLVLMVGIGIFAQAISSAAAFSARAQARERGNAAAADMYYTQTPEGVAPSGGGSDMTLTGDGTVTIPYRTGQVKSDAAQVAAGNQTEVVFQVYVPAEDPVPGP